MTSEAALCLATSRAWYEAMFRAHGLAASSSDGLWTSRAVAPPYHSNAMTLAPSSVKTQTQAIADLRVALARPFTVKDSFGALDLAPLGFRPLFDAQWVRRDSALPAVKRATTWRRVMRPSELERWDAAWRAGGSPADAPVFPPAFLRERDVLLFAAWRGDDVIGGFAATKSPRAVGFSNFFATESDAETFLADALDEMSRLSIGLPIVAYERGDDLERAKRRGFRAVGPLRVWTCDDRG